MHRLGMTAGHANARVAGELLGDRLDDSPPRGEKSSSSAIIWLISGWYASSPAQSRHALHERDDAADGHEVGVRDSLDVLVLHLYRDLPAVRNPRHVHLGERRRRDGLGSNSANTSSGERRQLGADSRRDLVEGRGGRRSWRPSSSRRNSGGRKLDRMLMSCPTLMNSPPAG